MPLSAGIDWSALDRLRKGGQRAGRLKGVMSPEEARKAVSAGVQGMVVSNYAARALTGVASPIEVLPRRLKRRLEGDRPHRWKPTARQRFSKRSPSGRKRCCWRGPSCGD